MRTTRKFKRGGVVTIAMMAVVPSLSSSGVGAGGYNKPLRDGNWAGTMVVGAVVDASSGAAGIVITGSGKGGFDLALAGGAASGVYTLATASDLAINGPGLTGSVDQIGSIVGTLEGIAGFPILQPSQAHFDTNGSITSGGTETPINLGLDVPAGNLLSSQLVIAASSCSIASGTWAHEFKSAIEGAGGSAKLQGSWAAKFTGTEPGATDGVLADILARGEAIHSQWFDTGTFDAAALEQVLLDADTYALSAPVTDACSPGPDGTWASPLAGMVRRLLFAIGQSDSTTAEVFRFAVAAGLHTSVLPSVDGDGLAADLEVKSGVLLDAAIAAGNKADVLMILIAADSMGWDDQVATASEALKGMP